MLYAGECHLFGPLCHSLEAIMALLVYGGMTIISFKSVIS